MDILERNSADMPSIFSYNGNQVTFKTTDGVTYVNATQMAKPFNARPNDYLNLKSTQRLLEAITIKNGNADFQLIITERGGLEPRSWYHEDVALDFAQWLSIDFKLWCNDRIKELLLNGVTTTNSLNDSLIILFLKKEQDKIREEYSKLEERSNKLEIISEFIHKSNVNPDNQLTHLKRQYQPTLSWQDSFVLTYEQYVYDNITSNIDEWLSLGTIPVAEFNSKYRPKGLGVKMYIRAIKRYCIHCNIRFIPHKVVYLTQTGSVRCRIFEK